MAITSATQAVPQLSLQELAKRHLWIPSPRHGAYDGMEVPIIVRGEGAYVWDEHGNRYLDGLSGLFCVNAGHGRTELGDAAARQVEQLDFYIIWSYAHPRAIELATRLAELAPADLNRVFFTSGGSEAIESAIKLARAYHQRTGNPRKTKFITREVAYHGTTLGALAATGISALRQEFEPLVPGGYQVPNTNSYVLRKQDEFRAMLDSLRDIPIVGDVRGDGFFYAIELVKDQETKEGFSDDESEWLLRGYLSGEVFRRGLICRADDRGDPVIQLSPPLICDTEQFEEIESVLRPVLTEAWELLQKRM